jgi:threonine dehydrogenase-like Zn-dependent dehydrogenase
MKIAILHGPRDLRIEEQSLPDELEPRQLRVRTLISAFKIGTDRGNYEGAERVPGAPDYPRWVGDSNLGVVTEVGEAVTRFHAGDRVVGNKPHQSEYIAGDHEAIVRAPDGAADEDAVYGWLYGLSSLCYRKAQFQPGENVAVVGLGVLGLGAVAIGREIGANVIAVGNSSARIEMARRVGANSTVMSSDDELPARLDDLTRGRGVDLVILTANPWPAYRPAVAIVRPGGRVAVVSLPGRGEEPLDFNPLDMSWFYIKGISLIAVSGQAGYLYPDAGARFERTAECEFVLSLMARQRLQPSKLITHRLPYTEMAAAYEMALRREKSMLGVIFDWGDA